MHHEGTDFDHSSDLNNSLNVPEDEVLLNVQDILNASHDKPEVWLYVNGKQMKFLCDSYVEPHVKSCSQILKQEVQKS